MRHPFIFFPPQNKKRARSVFPENIVKKIPKKCQSMREKRRREMEIVWLRGMWIGFTRLSSLLPPPQKKKYHGEIERLSQERGVGMEGRIW